MPPATYGVTPSGSQFAGNLSALWRKVQGTLREAANFLFPEWDDLKAFQNIDIDWSAREITAPFDLNEGAGVASIPEGGWEARPSSPTVVDATWTWAHINKRFTVSKISKMVQQKNRTAMIVEQFKFQGKKALEAIGTWIADGFYGFSTAVRAKVGSVTSGAGTTAQTIALIDAYGVTGLGNTGWAGTLFRPDEYVAFVRAGVLVADSFGKVTGVTAAGSLSVTFAVAPTLAANDSIVFANSLENTTLEGTDFNKGLVGFLEAFTATSLQGISGTTFPRWSASYNNSVAGRFTNIQVRRMKQAIANNGGGELTDIRWSFGVENDVFSQLQGGVMFPDMKNLQMDGDPKISGVTIKASRHVPPGYVFGYDRKSIRKMVLLPGDPKAPTWDDGEKVQDRSMYVFPIDYPLQLVYLNRGNLAIASAKTEQ